MNTKNFLEMLFPLDKCRWLGTWLRQKVCFSKFLVGFIISIFLFPYKSDAQCAMCRAVLESEENTAIAEGVNNGIVYLMAVPYILVGILFYFVYRKMKSR